MKRRSERFEVRNEKVCFGFFCVLLALLNFPTVSAFAQLTNDIPPLSPAYREIPPTYWEQHGTMIIIISISAFVIVALLFWLLLRPKSRPPEPPGILARRALEVLRQRNEDGAVLSEVSQVVRRYVIAAFGMPREEVTTAEFCVALGRNERVGAELSAALAEFLRRCDEWKFSPRPSAGSTNAAGRALQLVEQGEARCTQLRQAAATQSKPEYAAT